MNPESSNHPAGRTDLAKTLRQMRPARATIESAVVFYQVGFHAGQAQRQGRRLRLTPIAAAGLIAAIVAAPAGYMAGKTSLDRTASIDRQVISSKEVVAKTLPQQKPEVPSIDLEPATEPALLAVYKPELLAFWSGQAGIDQAQPVFDSGANSLADFHSSLLANDRTGKPWPDFSVRNEAFLHRDPARERFVETETSSVKTLAVLDVRELAESFGGVQ